MNDRGDVGVAGLVSPPTFTFLYLRYQMNSYLCPTYTVVLLGAIKDCIRLGSCSYKQTPRLNSSNNQQEPIIRTARNLTAWSQTRVHTSIELW